MFTSSAYPLEASTMYDPFAYFAHTRHKGNFSEAARVLAAEGYSIDPLKDRMGDWLRKKRKEATSGQNGSSQRSQRSQGSQGSQDAGRGVQPEPRLKTTRLSDVKARPVRWLVPDLIPLGKLTMIAGDGGHGKSSTTLDLAAALTKGRAAFGLKYDAPPPCEVLLISCEDDLADTVVPRLRAADADLARIHHVEGVPGSDGKTAAVQPRPLPASRRELEAETDIRLVVIDPAGAYIGRAGCDDHKDSELRALLARSPNWRHGATWPSSSSST